jgi:hypothetical protein
MHALRQRVETVGLSRNARRLRFFANLCAYIIPMKYKALRMRFAPVTHAYDFPRLFLNSSFG